jgi:hypothetical protein
MLLRDSEFKASSSFQEASSSFQEASALAREFKGSDPYGHRAEFIRLIDAAEGVTRLHTPAR